MDQRTLARELVRARLRELATMKKMLERVHSSLEKILAVRMEFQGLIEGVEEHIYEPDADLGEADAVQDSVLSFGGLLEIAVNKLKG
ncbi:hypothetical protein V7S43_017413 [Phytophthora oleae]|uniref:Uncharacterized protein n=1 Tax=Phytophthora oleae TaxID=2107226 RepID=A0ABD3EWX0_9STRA